MSQKHFWKVFKKSKFILKRKMPKAPFMTKRHRENRVVAAEGAAEPSGISKTVKKQKKNNSDGKKLKMKSMEDATVNEGSEGSDESETESEEIEVLIPEELREYAERFADSDVREVFLPKYSESRNRDG
ncbi:unnamed protein product [Haemonchus placei]|uniref:Uncharacterized protein n=1 Tax=Haemonchus placei TaxID=6290 RepID=A0A0N4WM49_HAEPC|nr:unnamed protein product [Haemonchus placei]